MRSLLVATAITSLLTLAAASKCLEKATWSHFVDATITVHGMPESDRIQRNHLIVYYYHEMGRCFDELLDTDREANWLIYGAWAAYTVGVSIREETGNIWIQEVLNCPNKYINEKICTALKSTPDAIKPIFKEYLDETANLLGLGNNLVFEQIAINAAKFGYALVDIQDTEQARVALNQFFAKNIHPQKNKLLIKSFTAYWNLRYNHTFTDPKMRSMELLYANALMGYEEQQNLQDYLARALKPKKMFGFDFDMARFFTKHFMSIMFPDNDVIFVGQDVSPLKDGSEFSPQLQDISEHQDLHDLYMQLVGQDKSLQGTATGRWSVIEDRMRFILAMFRSRGAVEQLLTCHPFSKKQMSLMEVYLPIEGPFCLVDCCAKNGVY